MLGTVCRVAQGRDAGGGGPAPGGAVRVFGAWWRDVPLDAGPGPQLHLGHDHEGERRHAKMSQSRRRPLLATKILFLKNSNVVSHSVP